MTERIELELALYGLARDHFCHFHHASSFTHIYWAPWMVPYGARGAHTFSDEAFEDYMRSAIFMITTASEKDLNLWMEESKKWVPKEEADKTANDEIDSKSKLIDLLQAAIVDNSTLSVPEAKLRFKKLLQTSMGLLNLDSKDIATRFGASLPTVFRWVSGANAPHPSYMVVIYHWLLLSATQDTK
jgi:hypothetical protein